MTEKLSRHDQIALTRGTTYEQTDTPEDTYAKTVNATARSAGAVGARALVPRKVREIARKDFTILDYGSGPKALHTLGLRADGYGNVTAHELGGNLSSVHDPLALTRTYALVMASNVLNVQPTRDDLVRVICELSGVTGGSLVCNYPASPRKSGLSTGQVQAMLGLEFKTVRRVGGSKQAPVWMCW